MPVPPDVLIDHPQAGLIWLLHDTAREKACYAENPDAACFSYRELNHSPLRLKRYRCWLPVVALAKRVFPGARLESIRSLRRRRRRITAPSYTAVDPDDW